MPLSWRRAYVALLERDGREIRCTAALPTDRRLLSCRAVEQVGGVVSMNAIAQRLESISSKTGVREREMAELLGTSAQTVHRWRKAQADPQSAHLRRILDLAFVAEELAELYDPAEARVWLYSRNRLLDSRRPVDLISGGDIDPVLQIIALLKDGAFA